VRPAGEDLDDPRVGVLKLTPSHLSLIKERAITEAGSGI